MLCSFIFFSLYFFCTIMYNVGISIKPGFFSSIHCCLFRCTPRPTRPYWTSTWNLTRAPGNNVSLNNSYYEFHINFPWAIDSCFKRATIRPGFKHCTSGLMGLERAWGRRPRPWRSTPTLLLTSQSGTTMDLLVTRWGLVKVEAILYVHLNLLINPILNRLKDPTPIPTSTQSNSTLTPSGLLCFFVADW